MKDVLGQGLRRSLAVPECTSPPPPLACFGRRRVSLGCWPYRVSMYASVQVPPYSLTVPECTLPPPLPACLGRRRGHLGCWGSRVSMCTSVQVPPRRLTAPECTLSLPLPACLSQRRACLGYVKPIPFPPNSPYLQVWPALAWQHAEAAAVIKSMNLFHFSWEPSKQHNVTPAV